MKLAFNPAELSEEAPADAAAQVGAVSGYDGLELSVDLANPGAGGGALERLSAEAGERASAEAGEPGGLLCANVRLRLPAALDARLADEVGRVIAGAGRLGWRCVSLAGGPALRRGQSASEAGVAWARWLAPLGESALRAGVTLAVENGPTFSRAFDLWTLLDRLNHPAVGCTWNASRPGGEAPAVWIPTLNSRLACVRWSAPERDADEAKAVARSMIRRLAGIGFEGCVIVDASGVAPDRRRSALAESADLLREPLAMKRRVKK